MTAPRTWRPIAEAPRKFDGFPLTDADLVRLKALGERARHSGIGLLASADYHGQGRVHVPAAWLVEIIERLERTAPLPPPPQEEE